VSCRLISKVRVVACLAALVPTWAVRPTTGWNRCQLLAPLDRLLTLKKTQVHRVLISLHRNILFSSHTFAQKGAMCLREDAP
jgi:hypothetical protein